MLLGFVSVSHSHSHDPADVMKKSPKGGSQKPKVVKRERERERAVLDQGF